MHFLFIDNDGNFARNCSVIAVSKERPIMSQIGEAWKNMIPRVLPAAHIWRDRCRLCEVPRALRRPLPPRTKNQLQGVSRPSESFLLECPISPDLLRHLLLLQKKRRNYSLQVDLQTPRMAKEILKWWICSGFQMSSVPIDVDEDTQNWRKLKVRESGKHVMVESKP